MSDFIQVQTTCDSLAAAEALATTLVDRRLAACVQIDGPLKSVYRWQGAIEMAEEYRCTIKTRQAYFLTVAAAIRELHSYDVPQIVALPITAMSPSYAAWMDAALLATTAGADWLSFDVHLHARPAGDWPAVSVTLSGGRYTSEAIAPELLDVPLTPSFERAISDLAELPRMFAEPDGSFVWRGDGPLETWQVDGVLYDRDTQLIYVEVKGTCPAEQFDRLLNIFGWPVTEFVFQIVQAGVFLGEAEFRRYATVCAARTKTVH